MSERKSRLEVLELIKNNQIGLEEGLKRIKDMGDHSTNNVLETPNNLDYYGKEWVKENDNVETTEDYHLTNGILIFDTDETIIQDIRTIMKQEGSQIIWVKPGDCFRKIGVNQYEINPHEEKEYVRLLEDLNYHAMLPQTILHSWSKEHFIGTESNIQIQLEYGIYSLFYLSKALLAQKLKKKVELLYVYPSNENNEASPLYAAVGGFAKTIRMENPLLSMRTVEVQNPDDVLKATMQVSGLSDEQVELRYLSGERYINQYRLINAENTPIQSVPLQVHGIYVITGGAGGLGLLFAKHLALTCKARLILAGRSVPSAALKSKIKELESLGAQVIYVQTDISKRQDVDELIERAKQQFGALNGVIHCAGILRDGFVLKKTIDEFKQVIAPKVLGGLYLDNATKDMNLDFFVLFASMAGTFGNVGQGDYAYANSFLDYFAAYTTSKNRFGRRVAIDWPLWKDGGMKADEETKVWMQQKFGVIPLRKENGIQAFEFALQSSIPQLMVLEVEQKGVNKEINRGKSDYKDIKIQKTHIVESEVAEFRERSRKYMTSIFAKEIKLPQQQVDPREPFESYGINSIMIMSLNRELEEHFGHLSKTLLFEYPTIAELTDYFIDNHKQKLMEKIGLSIQPNQEKQETFTKQQTQLPVKGSSFVKRPSAAGRSLFASQSSGSDKTNQITVQPSEEINHGAKNTDIAIIGQNGRFPQADDLKQFWSNLVNGVDCITEIPPNRWDHSKYYDPDKDALTKTYSKWGGFINDVDKFDPLFFNISPMEAEQLDPQERIFLEVVHHVLEDAGYTKFSLSQDKVGVFVGVMYGHYQLFHTQWKGNLISPAASFASIANRVSYSFNFQGPSISLDTMCSSSLTAMHLAIESIIRGESDVALVGGVNVTIHPTKYQHLSMKRFMSSDGRCRTFGVGGDGYVPGEGVGAVMLKPLNKAQEDGDHIYGVIKGVSINHGGKTNGYTVPNPKAQGNLISDVFKKTNINPRTISYIEAHGTGTPMGDPIEITGLTKAFDDYTNEKQFCSIGSVKTNIGHLESAAGIVAVIKVLLQMKYKQLVPSLHSKELNPNLNLADSPFFVQRTLEEWKQPIVIENDVKKSYPRRAGISSFGAGGSNAHVVMEEYELPELLPEKKQPRVFILSARKEERLKDYAKRILSHLETECKNLRLIDIIYTFQVGREELEERLALVVSTMDELIDTLREYCDGKKNINSLYRGTVRKKQASLIEGREGQEFLNVIINDRRISKLAQLWVSGVNIDWKLLYREEEPRRVSMPGYPFAKERYWIDEVEVSIAEQERETQLHPLVHRNISTLREQAYATTLRGVEFYLSDHVVNNQKVLPGVCYLEMARAAGSMAVEKPVVGLANVVWSTPLTVDNMKQTVNISLKPLGQKVEYTIFSEQNGGKRTQHSQGSLLFETTDEKSVEWIDIDEVLNRCTDVLSGMDWYQTLKKYGFEYGDRFQVISEIMGNHTEMISRLEISELSRTEFSDFVLHPSLMDGALQTVGSLMFDKGESASGTYLPYALGHVHIRGSISNLCYVYVQKKAVSSGSVKKFDIYLIDRSGKVLVMIGDFSARKFRSSNVSSTTDDSHLLKLLRQIEDGIINSDEAEKMMEEFVYE